MAMSRNSRVLTQGLMLALLSAGVLLSGARAWAGSGTGEQEDLCFADQEATDAERLAACTAAIESGNLSPDKLASAYTNRCLVHATKKANDLAIADCTKAIENDPKSALAYAQRGEAYCQKGDVKNCVADFDAAMRIDPEDTSFVYLRGVARADAGDTDGALVDLTKAIENDSGSAPAYVRRGRIYEAEGDKARAAADYRKALELDPHNETAKQRLDGFGKKQR
jgi:Tfp pilus assembly protein PilF